MVSSKNSGVESPKVSIINPCRNEEKYIAQNIDAILTQDYQGEIEVLIVDGMSTDNTRAIVSNYSQKNVRLVDNEARFTPNALNLGVDKSEGDIFIILGGHDFLNSDFVRKNVDVLLNDSSVGCSGGQILNIFENKAGELISKAMSSSFGVGNATFRVGGASGYVDTVAFGAYWKKIHYEIDGFDEDLVRNQDDEYNFKLTKAGYKIYFDPEIVSNYYVRGAITKLYRQYYQYGYWKVYVNKKHQTITTVRQLVPLFFVLGLILGTVLSIVFPVMTWLLLGGICLYVLLALVTGVKMGKRLIDGFKISGVFPVLHFSYGMGYLVGIIQFLVRGKKPSGRSKSSTRD